ncbi:MAG: phenylpyruvate tautomerase MIF-related protein [Chitinispirillaceae bacterium]
MNQSKTEKVVWFIDNPEKPAIGLVAGEEQRNLRPQKKGEPMPLLTLSTSVEIDEGGKENLLGQLSTAVAESLNKPEKFVMVTIEERAILMSGSTAPAAFASLSSIGGINGEANKAFSEKLCSLLKDRLGIEQERVYINFSDVERENWGWNGSTFAK